MISVFDFELWEQFDVNIGPRRSQPLHCAAIERRTISGGHATKNRTSGQLQDALEGGDVVQHYFGESRQFVTHGSSRLVVTDTS